MGAVSKPVSEQDQDGTGSVLILLASCQQYLYDM
jgi:hypothetical protein